MITITETFDADLVKEIVTDKSVYFHVADDLSPMRCDYAPQFGEDLHWLLIKDDDTVCGCFFIHRLNAAMYECHTCILRGHRGEKAVEAAISGVSWVFSKTPCKILITHVPGYNMPAYKLAEAAGFSYIGTIKDGWLKGGETEPLHLLGVQKCR